MSEETQEEGSTFKVPLTEILEIQEHPNAHSLEIAVVYGFQVIVSKDKYKVGDRALYIPIDSILPQDLEDLMFPEGSKIKLSKHRVKQIRLRKIASQGMLIDPIDIRTTHGFLPDKLEKDYKEELNITKYEPPTPKFQLSTGNQAKRNKPLENANFHKYNGLNNIKWFPTMFKNDDIVVMQEKIHGSHARASIMPFQANTIWKKIKKLLGLVPKFEFCYGSNNVQLQERAGYTGFYGEDIYGRVFQELDVKNKLKEGESIYGEIYGEGIQKNYNYGLKGSQKFILFDVKILSYDGTQKWLNPDEVASFAKERGFDMVPEVYRGPFSIEIAKKMTEGNSILAPSQKVREGVVVKAIHGYSDDRGSKKALKVISEKYLDKEQTDFH